MPACATRLNSKRRGCSWRRSASRVRARRRGVLSKLRQTARAERRGRFLPPDQAFKVSAGGTDAQYSGRALRPCRGLLPLPRQDCVRACRRTPVSRSPKSSYLPRGEKKTDPNFGETEVFHGPFRRWSHWIADRAARSASLWMRSTRAAARRDCAIRPAKKRFDLSLAAWQPGGDAHVQRGHARPRAAGTARRRLRRAAVLPIRAAALAGDTARREFSRSLKSAQVRQLLADRGELLRLRSAVALHALCVPHGSDPVRDHRRARAADHQAATPLRCR